MKTIFAVGTINWNQVKMNEASEEDKTKEASKTEPDLRRVKEGNL